VFEHFHPRPPRKPARLPRVREADGRERCGQAENVQQNDPVNPACPVGPEDRTGVDPV